MDIPPTVRNSICPYALPEMSHFMTGKTWDIWRPEPNFAEYWDTLLYNPQYQEYFGKTGMNWIPTYDSAAAAAGHD